MLVGWGALLWRWLGSATALQPAADWDLFRLFWLGFCGLVVPLQLISLVLPLHAAWLCVALVVACPGLWLIFRQQPQLRVTWSVGVVLFSLLLAAVLLRAALNVGLPVWPGAYDTDLYHFSAVRWAKDYAVVPGLANLHIRLGMSSTALLYSALVDHGLWAQRSAWLVQSLFLLVALAQWLWILFGSAHAPFRVKIFCWCSLPWLIMSLGVLRPSLYYDQLALLLQAVVVLELLRFPWGEAGQAAPAEQRRLMPRLALPLWLAATAFTIKPIGVATLVGAGVLPVLFLWRSVRQHRGTGGWSCGMLLGWGAPPALLLAGYLARNAVLTGWLLFPAPVGRLPVDWAVPERPADASLTAALQSVRGVYAVIRGWARRPDTACVAAAQAPLATWGPAWWDRNRGAPAWNFLAAGLVLATLAGVCGRWRAADPPLICAGLVTAFNLAQWFLLVPELRFGDAFFTLAFGLGAALLWPTGTWRPFHTVLAALAVVLMGWWWCAHPALAIPADPWQIGRAGASACKQVVVQNGQQPPLVVWTPCGDDRCGDAPLPCTPYPRDNLCLRVPGNVGHGFYVKPDAAPPAAN